MEAKNLRLITSVLAVAVLGLTVGCNNAAPEEAPVFGAQDTAIPAPIPSPLGQQASIDQQRLIAQTQPFGTQSLGTQIGITQAVAPQNPPSPEVYSDTPPNPLPGQCYQRVFLPAKTQTMQESVQVKAASREVKVVPAKYGTVNEQVVVKQAVEDLVVIPATYKTVTEEVIIRPAARKLVTIPPRYENVTRRVLVRSAQSSWKRGQVLEGNTQYGRDAVTLVEEPEVYKTVTERVMVDPGGTKVEIVPAITDTITKEVVDQPARVERKVIPAVTKTVQKSVIIEPAREAIVESPAEYKMVDVNKVSAPARNIWVSVLCENNTTSATIKQIQSALSTRGYDVGPIDGVAGRRTAAALESFQRRNGLLPYGFTIETVRALGLGV